MATKSLDSLSDIPPELPLSYLLDNVLSRQHHQPEGSELTGETTSSAQKRGRGRPPKPRPNIHQNGHFHTNPNNASVTTVADEAPTAKRSRGRPRKDGAPVGSKDSPIVVEAAAKGRGRPPGSRGRGRPRKSKPLSSLERVSPIVLDGPKKRGRPRKYSVVAAPASLEIGESTAAVTLAKRRGRPPKVSGVISVSPTGRPRGRPRKDGTPTAAEVPRGEAADYGALKRKYKLLQDKVKEATNKLKAAVSAMDEVRVIAAAMDTE